MFTIQEETEQQLLSGPTHMINTTRQGRFTFDSRTINMEIYTESGVTVLSKQDFDKGYSEGIIICLGEKVMSVQINNQTKDAVIRVVDSKGPSLLGTDLISIFTLPWENIFKVNTNSECDKIFDKYTDLFDNSQIGKIKGLKVQLHDDINPIFRKTRPVPYAIRDKYNASLDKLEKQVIIEKVEFAEWASPVVPVVKSNGHIRLCGVPVVKSKGHIRLCGVPVVKSNGDIRLCGVPVVKSKGGIRLCGDQWYRLSKVKVI